MSSTSIIEEMVRRVLPFFSFDDERFFPLTMSLSREGEFSSMCDLRKGENPPTRALRYSAASQERGASPVASFFMIGPKLCEGALMSIMV
jgi:hypothetical protein